MKISEAIYNGLTNLGESLCRINKDRQEHELESWEWGFITDEKRLKILKQDLYRNARSGKDTEELRKAIELLNKEVDKQNDAQYSTIHGLTNICVVGTLAWILFSFVGEIKTKCPHIESGFCNQMRQIDMYFNGDNSPLLPDNTGK